MTNDIIKKPLLVFIYPYKFSDFVYSKMELDYFKRYCEVLVWDISPITTPNFAKAVGVGRPRENGIIVLSSLRDFVRHVYELRKLSVRANVCILSEVYNTSLFEVICNLIIAIFLRAKNVTILDFCNDGWPLRYPIITVSPNEHNQNLGFFGKALRFAKDVSTLSEAKKTISTVLFLRLGRLLPSATTHRLVAGEDWLGRAQGKSHGKNRIKLVYGHSQDYSNYLLDKLKLSAFVPTHNKIAVLLDGPGPMFTSDLAYLKRKAYLTNNVWYPALCRFFDRIELETGVRIEIAGHYKSNHPAIAPIFGNRPVHYGKTMNLVRNSEFVITRTSTSISYAVIFKKPIIFIYSNQLNEDRSAMRNIRGMAALMGNVPLNIDDPHVEINSFRKVNDERYIYYEKACLTSTRSQWPNVQIILEDVMNIPTGPELFRDNR